MSVPPSSISTPRLHLVRLTDTSPGSQHVQWFHENWSDPTATAWSLHGATKNLDESRAWMLEHMHKWDTWFYAVFLRDSSRPTSSDPGQHVGSVSLRRQQGGPALPPPTTFQGAPPVGSGAPLSDEEMAARLVDWRRRDVPVRVLGYALFADAQGRGYATEACAGLLGACADAVRESRAGAGGAGDEAVGYVEAGVDQDNLGSQGVLRKLGFRTVGLKVEEERVWLDGAWRGPGWWITGLYV